MKTTQPRQKPTILTHPSQLQWRHVMTWPPCEPSNEERCSCHPILSTTECSNPCAEFHRFPCWASGMGSCPKHLLRPWDNDFSAEKKKHLVFPMDDPVKLASVHVWPGKTAWKNCLEPMPVNPIGAYQTWWMCLKLRCPRTFAAHVFLKLSYANCNTG